MAERNDIPRRDIVYTADDDKQLGELYTVEDKQYKFVKFPAGVYVRKYDALNVDSEGNATPVLNAQTLTNAIAAIDVDNNLGTTAKYAMVIWKGQSLVAISGDTVTCVYKNAKLVPYQNGQMRFANAAFTLGVGIISTNTATSAITLSKTAEANYAQFAVVGDVVNVNTGIYATINQVVNGSSIIVTGAALGQTNAASYACTVVLALGGMQKANMACTSANSTFAIINAPTATVNLCSASTVVFANSSVSGYLVKVGDVLKGPNSSTRLVTAINNAYAFTINAAMDTETSGNVGSVWNINAKYATVVIG